MRVLVKERQRTTQSDRIHIKEKSTYIHINEERIRLSNFHVPAVIVDSSLLRALDLFSQISLGKVIRDFWRFHNPPALEAILQS